MVRKIIFSFLLLAYSFSVKAQENTSTGKRISLLFMGDIMGHDEQIWSAEIRETHMYNYDTVFYYIKNEIAEADLAVANLEVTLAGPPYTGYPAFSTPSALAASCRNAGIDILMTANNHAADRGKRGILGTISRLDSLGIKHTGTFIDALAKDTLSPMIVEKNGFRLAFLNYTYATNGIAVPLPLIVNMLDKGTVTADIKKARMKNPDAVILFLHWGTEYDTIPSKTEKDLADYFFSQGADIIIGSHPHVIQKMEWTQNENLKDRLVVYSLGNFVSNQRRTRTDGGTMVRIELAKDSGPVRIKDAAYYLTWVYAPIENYRKRFYILSCSKFENNPGFFTKSEDFSKMKLFIRNSRHLLYGQNIRINELIYSGNSWMY